MVTWWIIRLGNSVFTAEYLGSAYLGQSVGPYWTREEAEQMLKKWR